MLEPRLLVGPEGRAAAQADNSVARIDQPDVERPRLPHLPQHGLGRNLVVHAAVAVEPVLVGAEDLLVLASAKDISPKLYAKYLREIGSSTKEEKVTHQALKELKRAIADTVVVIQ